MSRTKILCSAKNVTVNISNVEVAKDLTGPKEYLKTDNAFDIKIFESYNNYYSPERHRMSC